MFKSIQQMTKWQEDQSMCPVWRKSSLLSELSLGVGKGKGEGERNLKLGQTRILVERGELESKVGANGNYSLVWCPWIRSWDKLEFCFTPKYDSNSPNPTTIWSHWNFPLRQLPVQPNRYSEKLAKAFHRRTTHVNLVFYFSLAQPHLRNHLNNTGM